MLPGLPFLNGVARVETRHDGGARRLQRPILERTMPPFALLRSARAFLRTCCLLLVAAGGLSFAASCTPGDVGAPCNHGVVKVAGSNQVTFPALYCDQLLCVYAESKAESSADCENDMQCNAGATGNPAFECVDGSCQLRTDYVLERSMCSKRCSSDDDCNDSGASRVVAKKTECNGGFRCARIQEVGEFCCARLCVCDDDLPTKEIEDLDMACSMNQPECCQVESPPVGCGAG